ncbi:MAG: feoB [Planctomycetaceae bacterium]|nr:feoB [Planctomycetaceae bacterium]
MPPPLKIALIGNPNTGKSTLFNALSGLQSRVGNFPGVTVEKKIGRVQWGEQSVDLIDLPGTYSLAPRSLDEMVSVNVLLGKQDEVGLPDAVICIVDASNLERNLYLASQILDIGLPTILVLNMFDVAESRGQKIDVAGLEARLGLPVVKCSAHRKSGIDDIRAAVERALAMGVRSRPPLFPAAFAIESQQLAEKLAHWGHPNTPPYLIERLLLDVGGWLESHFGGSHAHELFQYLQQARERLAAQGCKVPMIEARTRYAWARETLKNLVEQPATRPANLSDRIDKWLTHRYVGFIVFAFVMLLVFQAISSGAEPFKYVIEAGQEWLSGIIISWMSPGPFRSLIVDGVIGGTVGVLVFLPQIVLLFLFIALLEDCGYMARAAFLMDKLMTKVGLSGKSFVPLMSSFACAVPGIMATRVIENRRDRMVTILVAPLMSCSARLPVYVLMVTAFVPEKTWLWGFLSLHALTLLGMTFLGAFVAIPVAWILKKTLFKGETPPFVMELPGYKWPSAWIVFSRVYDRAMSFVTRAGTLILTMSVLIWAACYFPGDHQPADHLQSKIETLEAELEGADDPRHREIETLAEQQNVLNSALLEQSYLGRFGHAVEPLVRPLGWDWKIGVGVIASFPAREVIISTLGTIYSLGSEVKEESSQLKDELQHSTWPDGSPVFTLPVAVSIMVFFALCAQCVSTLLVIRRETNSWGWAAFTFVYMTVLAYLGALICYQVGTWLMA